MSNNDSLRSTRTRIAQRLWEGLIDVRHPAAVKRFGKLLRELRKLDALLVNPEKKAPRGTMKRANQLKQQIRSLMRDMPAADVAMCAPIGCLYSKWSWPSAVGNRVLRDHIRGMSDEQYLQSKRIGLPVIA